MLGLCVDIYVTYLYYLHPFKLLIYKVIIIFNHIYCGIFHKTAISHIITAMVRLAVKAYFTQYVERSRRSHKKIESRHVLGGTTQPRVRKAVAPGKIRERHFSDTCH